MCALRLSPLCLMLAVAPLSAQTPDMEKELMDLLNTPITTASKVAQKAGDAPATVQVVTQDQIRRRGYRSLLQVLRDLPDVKVDYRSDVEWFADFTIRGIPGHDKFVVLLDGVRISPPTNEQIPLLENYPVHLAKQVEVVYGPASALYGPDAVSGVVNIITRDPSSGGEATLALDGDGMRFGNVLWGRELGNGMKLSIAGQWMVDPQPDLEKHWADFQGFGPQRGNQFQTIFGPMSASVPYDPDPGYATRTQAVHSQLVMEHFRFMFFKNSVKTSTSMLNSPNDSIYTDAAFIGHGVTVGGLSYHQQLGAYQLQSSISGSLYELNPNSNFRNAYTGMNPGYKYASSSSWKAEQQVLWSRDATLQVTGGLSFELLNATPWSTDLQAPVDTSRAVSGTILGTPLEADFFHLGYKNLGLYLQGQFQLSPTLIATLGARYDDNSRYGSTTNPRLGLVWNVNPKNTLKLLYGSAFLAPSPYAAFAHFGSFFSEDGGSTYKSFYWRLPNPGLQPIKEKAFEVSYRTYFASDLSLSLSAYHTKLQNLYALADDATTTKLYNGHYRGWPVAFIEVRTNLGSQTITGGTVQLDYLKILAGGRLNAFVAISQVDGKVDPMENGHEVEIGLISPTIARAGVEFTRGAFSGSARYTSVGRQRMNAMNADGKRMTLSGYQDLELSLRWLFNPRTEAFLTVKNGLDARYRNVNPHGVPSGGTELFGSPQDPRRIALGVQMRF